LGGKLLSAGGGGAGFSEGAGPFAGVLLLATPALLSSLELQLETPKVASSASTTNVKRIRSGVQNFFSSTSDRFLKDIIY